MEPYNAEKAFDKKDFAAEPLLKGEYENCSFIDCDLSNADLSGIRFIGCLFSGCNLSLAKLEDTAFRDAKFKDCKMLGLRFENCNEFGFSFSVDNCNLSHSTFYKMKIKKTIFRNAQFHEADFTECDLTASVFDGCDLARATFVNAVLEKTDFRTAINYSIDPDANRVKKARFSLEGVAGLLDKYDIEIDSTHGAKN